MNSDLQRIAGLLERLVAANQKGLWDYASIVAVVLTLIVVGYYTYETYKLRQIATEQLAAIQKQNEMAILPFLVPGRTVDGLLTIKNIGKAAAFNVKALPIENHELRITFMSKHVLDVGEEYCPVRETFTRMSPTSESAEWEQCRPVDTILATILKNELVPPDDILNFDVKIEYENIVKTHYRTAFRIAIGADINRAEITYLGSDAAGHAR